MDPLVSILLVLSTAVLWAAFTFLMLTRLNREWRRAMRQQRKADRMKNRLDVLTDDPDGTGRARRHHLKVWRHHPSSTSRRTAHG